MKEHPSSAQKQHTVCGGKNKLHEKQTRGRVSSCERVTSTKQIIKRDRNTDTGIFRQVTVTQYFMLSFQAIIWTTKDGKSAGVKLFEAGEPVSTKQKQSAFCQRHLEFWHPDRATYECATGISRVCTNSGQ